MSSWWQLLPLVLSNFTFLLPAIRALQYKLIINAFVYFSLVVVSSLYHLCKVDASNEPGEGGICFLLTFRQYRHMDWFFAQLVLFLTATYFISFGAIVDKETGRIIRMPFFWLRDCILYYYALIMAISLLLIDIDDNVIVIISMAIALPSLILIFWLQAYFQYNLKPKFDYIDLSLGLFLTIASVILVSTQKIAPDSAFWVIHSIWHVGIAVGQFYLMDSRNKEHSGIGMFAPWKDDVINSVTQETTPLDVHKLTLSSLTYQQQHQLGIHDIFSQQQPHIIELNRPTFTYYDNYMDKDPWMIPGHSVWRLFQWALPPPPVPPSVLM